MRNTMKALVVLAGLLSASVASAKPVQPAYDAAYEACVVTTGDLWLGMASSAGYSDAYDLAGLWAEGVSACLVKGGWSAQAAKAEVESTFCTVVADHSKSPTDPNGHAAYEVCEVFQAERNAERAP